MDPTAVLQAIDIVDATKVREAGFDLIYEARDLDLPQVSYRKNCALHPFLVMSLAMVPLH